MSKSKVTGLIIGSNGVTLFVDGGLPKVFDSASFKTQAIIEAVSVALAKGEVAEIDLDSFSLAGAVERATGGKVKINEATDEITTPHGKVKGARALQGHLERIATGEGAKGFTKFTKLLSEVVKKRGHTAKELLNFLANGDLPIADDGMIIGYKILNHSEDHFVDPHTNRVKQKLGTLVYMPAEKVDPNRRNLCSNGLHVCSRDYIAGFGGSAVALVKVNPIDVIAVPEGERSKMRVSAYHIVAILPPKAKEHLGSRALTEDSEFTRILAQVVAGDHPGILERVKVGERGAHEVEGIAAPKKRKAVTTPLPQSLAVKPEAKRKLDVGAIKNKVKAAVGKITGKDNAYEKKLKDAARLLTRRKDPMSQREVAKALGMDRESMVKNLRSRGLIS